MPQRRLGTVVAGPDRDPLAVECLANLDRVEARHHERQHAHLLAGGAHQAQPVDGGQAAGGVFEEGVLVDGDPLPS